MPGRWHGGKGSTARQKQCTGKEFALRYELAFCKCDTRRKEIEQELEKIKNETDTNANDGTQRG